MLRVVIVKAEPLFLRIFMRKTYNSISEPTMVYLYVIYDNKIYKNVIYTTYDDINKNINIFKNMAMFINR